MSEDKTDLLFNKSIMMRILRNNSNDLQEMLRELKDATFTGSNETLNIVFNRELLEQVKLLRETANKVYRLKMQNIHDQ